MDKLASFMCTQTQLPTLSSTLETLRDFTFLLCFLAPFPPIAETENDHQLASLILEPCSQLLTASEGWVFATLQLLWSGWLLILPSYYKLYLFVSSIMPSLNPCVIHRDWWLSSFSSIPSQLLPLQKGQRPTLFNILTSKCQVSPLPSNPLKILQTPHQLVAATRGRQHGFLHAEGCQNPCTGAKGQPSPERFHP